MQTPIRVALSMRVTHETRYEESRDSISHDWLAHLASWRMTPLLIPNLIDSPEAYLESLAPDLLVLTGGGDPGATPERDATESRLLAHALARALPVLGVCRGMQMVNLHFGGRLATVEGHVAQPHPVQLAAAWQPLYGARVTVNSFHALGVAPDGLAQELVAFAHDADGNVEALHHAVRPLAAVMWHPERAEAPEGDRRLVERLVQEGAFWA